MGLSHAAAADVPPDEPLLPVQGAGAAGAWAGTGNGSTASGCSAMEPRVSNTPACGNAMLARMPASEAVDGASTAWPDSVAVSGASSTAEGRSPAGAGASTP